MQTADGKQFPVKEIKTDQEHDVAVLKIDTNAQLPFVSLGDSDKAEIGDWVLTIGCPLELEQTVSAGIISAKKPLLLPPAPNAVPADQTQLSIREVSGGPLVALNGTIIGITTSIASDDGGYQGIGFCRSRQLCNAAAREGRRDQHGNPRNRPIRVAKIAIRLTHPLH